MNSNNLKLQLRVSNTRIIHLIFFSFFYLFLVACSNEDQDLSENFIKVSEISHADGSILKYDDYVTIEYAYNISQNELEQEGFYLRVFCENENGTFSPTTTKYHLTKRSGTASISFKGSGAFSWGTEPVAMYLVIIRYQNATQFSRITTSSAYHYTLER